MTARFLTATNMAKERGVTTGQLFKALIEESYINPLEEGPRKWEITQKGIQAGAYYTKNSNGEFILWPADLQLQNLQEIKKDAAYKQSQQKANTEGELYIKDFFREAGINCKPQETIRNLSHDVKGHRVADFYLPDYGAYVEFFGHWNTSEEYREDYRIKKKVYTQNNIPCVFLYPENLGYIHFVFDHRLMEALKNHYKEKELKKYKRWKWLKGTKDNFWGIALCIVVLALMVLLKEEGKAVIVLLILYNIYKIITVWNLIYVKKTYSISRMLYD